MNLQNLKIAFVGAECTGKSTLSKMLSEKLQLPYIPDPYEKAISKLETSLGNEWNLLGDQSNWFFEKAMHEAQIEMEDGLQHFVADSASLVRIACAYMLCGIFAPQEDLRDLVNESLNNSRNYTHLVYLPPKIDYIDNGHRLMNENIRRGVDNILQTLLVSSIRWTIVYVPSTNLEKNLQYLYEYFIQ